jgi:hypothetical protein
VYHDAPIGNSAQVTAGKREIKDNIAERVYLLSTSRISPTQIPQILWAR